MNSKGEINYRYVEGNEHEPDNNIDVADDGIRHLEIAYVIEF